MTRYYPRLLMVAACAVMIASAYAFRPFRPDDELIVGTILLLIGIVIVGRALWLNGRTPNEIALPVPTHDSPTLEKMRPVHVLMIVFGFLALALLAEINGKALHIAALDSVTSNAQFALLCLGIALVVVGFSRASLPHRVVVNWRVVGAIGAIMLLAFGLRLWQLNISIHFLVDELSFTTGILNIRARDTTEILVPMEGTAAFPFIFAYWQSKGVEVLGRNLAGMRVASAVIGTLTIPALYGLAKAIFDHKVALLAAFLLAVFPPHLHFSRIGLTEIASCLFGTLALAFLARGVIHNRRLDYAIGGAMLGMTHYFHEGGRLLFTPLAVVWVIALFILWRPKMRLHKRNVLVAGLVTVIVAFPIYYTLVARGLTLGARISAPDIILNGEYWSNMFASGDFSQHIRLHILDSLLVYVHQQDRTFFYHGHTGLVLVYLVPALLLGVAFVLWRWRAPGSCLLILWVLATSAGNSFLIETVTVPRYVVVFPALVLLLAVGIRYSLLLILPGLQRAQWVIVGGMAAVFAVLQVNYYFNEHLPIYNFAARDALPHRDGQDAVFRSARFSAGTQLHFISNSPPNGHYTAGLMSFLRDDLSVEIITTEEFTPAYVNNLNPEVDHAFYVDEATGVFSLLLKDHFDVEAPVYGPFDLPLSQQYILYYARHRDSAGAGS